MLGSMRRYEKVFESINEDVWESVWAKNWGSMRKNVLKKLKSNYYGDV